jgi:hypothetical protein
MKTIKISSYKALSLIFVILSTTAPLFSAQAPLMVTMRYTTKSTVVQPNVNYSGTRIITNMHETGGVTKITFEIPRASDQNHFYCLATSANIGGILKNSPEGVVQQNTLECLAIDPTKPYKFYDITLIKDPCPDGAADPLCPINPSYHFDIKEETLPETGQLPDRTIIIACEPTWIVSIKGGTQPELTILLDNSMTEKFESDEKFEEAVIKLQLAALDSNALHASTRRKIKTDGRCTRIIDSLT